MITVKNVKSQNGIERPPYSSIGKNLFTPLKKTVVLDFSG
jgi:hypothetical protein